jgi:methyl-accepting chemotaxis protein
VAVTFKKLSFKNLSIQAKVAAVPTGILLALLGLGVYAFLLLSDNEAKVRELNSGVIEEAFIISAFDAELGKSRAKLYQITATAGNESDAKKVTAVVKAAMDEFTKFGETFAPVKKALLDAGMPGERVEALEKSFAAYIKAAKNVLNLADGDVGTALTFMQPTERRFNEASTIVDQMQKTMDTARSEAVSSIIGSMASGRTIFAAAIGGILLVAAALSLVLSRLISRPIATMASAIGDISRKSYDVTIPALGQKDEIGRMASAVETLRTQSQEADRLASEQEKEQRLKEERRQRVDALVSAFNDSVKQVVASVSGAATQLRGSAESMSSTATQAQRQASTVATGAEEASANVQTVAAASEELSSSIIEISRQVADSAKIANQAVDEATNTNMSVQSLADAAQKIGEVVKLIAAIAGQTNLLALNATIEAARAGEAGKGFAVVASEVKNLATQTAKATEDITQQVNAIQAATRDSVGAISGIGKTIGEINQIATAIASAVEEQGAATQEIARNVQQAAQGTHQVSANIGGVTEATNLTGQAAGEVLGAADGLTRQAAALQAEIEKFVVAIRAA